MTTQKVIIEHSVVFEKLSKAVKKIIVLEGGARSGKTFAVLQYILLEALREPQIITIARSKLTWVKLTVLKDFRLLWAKYDLPITPEYNINRADQTYYLNGSEITFLGLDEAQKYHGRTQDIFFLNEAIEATYEDYRQLAIRTGKRFLFDYNPRYIQHWIYDKIIPREDCEFIHSTWRDNPFLEQSIIDELERMKIEDPTGYRIYNLGLRGQYEGVIFTNWSIEKDMPEDSKLISFGLDFGFTHDPSALVELRTYNNKLYISCLLYETGLTNRDIYLKINQAVGRDLVIADSSEPKSIEELRRMGLNVRGVRKGPDSVRYGINALRGIDIVVTESSIDLIKEMRQYSWAKDKQGFTDKPEDMWNHAIDAFRYAAENFITKRTGHYSVS